VLDAVGALLEAASPLVLGWRPLVCLGCSAMVACSLAWFRAPRIGEAWALAALVVLGYLIGLWWDFAAARRRRSGSEDGAV
jgi:hypothetical protein